jgi:hypothetical protein
MRIILIIISEDRSSGVALRDIAIVINQLFFSFCVGVAVSFLQYL